MQTDNQADGHNEGDTTQRQDKGRAEKQYPGADTDMLQKQTADAAADKPAKYPSEGNAAEP